ncbi:MAG: M4 family metallopeptidase, partial [bacterium]|nr:M4 family metallopeptidase [bacterium]
FGNGGPGDNSYRWLMGEDANAPGLVGAIRDMWNPTCYSDPGKVTDTQYHCGPGTLDQGGVHTNSGIPNHAYALMVDGGTYNGFTITGLGLTKAAHIEWAAQIMLTLTSDFVENADALEAACSSLIGTNLNDLSTGLPSGIMISAADCTEVADINAAVEMRTLPTQCDFEPILDPNAPALCDGVGSVQTIDSEDFEGGSLPAGWTASSHDVVNPGTFSSPGWSVTGGLPAGASGSFAAFGPDLITGDCVVDIEAGVIALDSPPIVLPVGEVPHVAFTHWVATEAGWDGGNLKVSVNGDPWEVVPG